MKKLIFSVLIFLGVSSAYAQKKENLFLWEKGNTTIKLGGFVRVVTSADFDGSVASNVDITLYQNQFNALNTSNAQLQAENDALKKQVADIATKEPVQTQVEKVIEKQVVIPVPVFFDLNKWDVLREK